MKLTDCQCLRRCLAFVQVSAGGSIGVVVRFILRGFIWRNQQTKQAAINCVEVDDCQCLRRCLAFVQVSAGGSIGVVVRFTLRGFIWRSRQTKQAAINCAAGLHHAKKQASIDINDINVYYGDGLENAFFIDLGITSFPKVGVLEVSERNGKYYAVKVPLDRGMDDDSFGAFNLSVKTLLL
ncbi:hypothetical protein F0562_031925 [Nyssa sinensis]|uniref:Uncharacterized protein n=1 Tax=Nyssa sinensis TaxID=561372 RepID=A0A5J5AVR7_9ASTE|nr:hypothetical protein F0562_031925 [Nyssa sinensis]